MLVKNDPLNIGHQELHSEEVKTNKDCLYCGCNNTGYLYTYKTIIKSKTVKYTDKDGNTWERIVNFKPDEIITKEVFKGKYCRVSCFHNQYHNWNIKVK